MPSRYTFIKGRGSCLRAKCSSLQEAFMRTYFPLRYVHQAIAVIAIILISFGVKMLFLSAPTAEAVIHAAPSTSMDVHQMQIDHANGNSSRPKSRTKRTFSF